MYKKLVYYFTVSKYHVNSQLEFCENIATTALYFEIVDTFA